MSRTVIKSLLLAFVVFSSLFALYQQIPAMKFFSMQLSLGIAIFILFFIVKNEILNLLLLWFIVVLYGIPGASIRLAFLPDIFPERIILILIGGLLILKLIERKIRLLSLSAIEWAMTAFSVYVIFSMIIGGTINIEGEGFSPGKFLIGFGFPFIIFFISKNIVDDDTKIRKVFLLLVIVGLYLGLTAIFEHFNIRALVFPRRIMGWQHGYRAAGPFLHAPVNGMVMGMLLSAPIFLFLHENKRLNKLFYFITAICICLGILFSFTRSAWLASFVAMSAIAVFIRPVRRGLFIVLLIGSMFFLISSYFDINIREIKEAEFKSKKATFIEQIVNRTLNRETVEGREDMYWAAFQMFLDKPFFGHGYFAFQKYREDFVSYLLLDNKFAAQRAGIHNTPIALLVDLGLTGFALYMFMYLYLACIGIQLFIKLPQDTFIGKDFIVALMGMFIVYFINSQFFDVRFFLFPNALFFCLAGIAVGLNQRNLERHKPSNAS